MVTIPIGVTARNEAKNILVLLDSLRVAMARATSELGCRYELHVLLNDNDDDTPRLLAGAADVKLWHTYGGLVEAQRALAEHAVDAPFLIFSDADIRVAPDALLEVSRAMLSRPELEVAYAEKYPLEPVRRTLLARALYFYNLREGYQTERHYFNGQFFAIRHWHIPAPGELRWDAALENRFRNLAVGIRIDDIYLSREVLSRIGPEAILCVPGGGIWYWPPRTLRGMFRKYQRMRLEIERLDCFFPPTREVHRRWGQRRLDRSRLAAAPWREKLYYAMFQLALVLCKLAYQAQRGYFTYLAGRDCPTWTPVTETKERVE
jgi:glycosyltransferase involved in cell wall biosynthesis